MEGLEKIRRDDCVLPFGPTEEQDMGEFLSGCPNRMFGNQ